MSVLNFADRSCTRAIFWRLCPAYKGTSSARRGSADTRSAGAGGEGALDFRDESDYLSRLLSTYINTRLV